MRPRPVRSNTLKPLPRLGINVENWKYILAGGFALFAAPFALNLWVWVVPVGAFTGPVASVALFAFFNWVNRGKRPLWFQHQMKALGERWSPWRRALPGDYSDVFWLK
jgi:hypothetical protein